MGKSLFITEKPSVAMEFAKALGCNGSNRKSGYIEEGNIIITWCVGHLVEMSYPEKYDPELKKWSLDSLPFIPKTFKYETIASSKDQYNIVARLLNQNDVEKIYYSGDSAREGEYIQRLVRQEAGHNPKAAEFRVWIDSQTKEEILRGIKEAKPLSEYDQLSDSAYARAIEDYLVGLNFSRALSLKYAKAVSNALGEEYHPIAVGRVMSCVLGMIVNRERVIRNTRVVSYYTIQADLGNGILADWKITDQSKYKNTPQNYNDIGLLDQILTKELLTDLQKSESLKKISCRTEKSKKLAPLLFNLAELQSECAKRFKISPSVTLEIAQSLYEKKLTTYPRTDARVLTTAMAKVCKSHVQGLVGIDGLSDIASRIISEGLASPDRLLGTKYIDDTKVSDHYAIIPTGQTNTINELTDIEEEVYNLIARRFLSVFLEPAEYEKIIYELMGQGESFSGSVTYLKKEGYLAAAGYEKEKEKRNKILFDHGTALFAGTDDILPADFSLRSGRSKPPARYTSGSIILAMENAGNLIEDAELREQIKGSGIGTSSTRASVIEKLNRNQYISIDKKTQTIHPMALGELIYEVLHYAVPNILNPEYTASWERGLQGIVEGAIAKDHYLDKIYNYVSHGVKSMKEGDYSKDLAASMEQLKKVYPEISLQKAGTKNDFGITCPICGKPILSNDKGYYCSGYKEGCRFNIWKEVKGVILPKEIVMQMIQSWKNDGHGGGHSGASAKMTGFQFKHGNGEARLRLVMKAGEKTKIEFVFD